MSSSKIQWPPLPSKDQAISKITFGSCSLQCMTNPHWDTLVKLHPGLVRCWWETVTVEIAMTSGAMILKSLAVTGPATPHLL
jgi:hypothetical protein